MSARRIGFTWVVLLALMFSSLGAARLPLGDWNLVIGLAIAAVKSAIVLALFMRLARGPVITRIALVVGGATLALLFGLSSVDIANRTAEPAKMQQPQQLRPLREGGELR